MIKFSKGRMLIVATTAVALAGGGTVAVATGGDSGSTEPRAAAAQAADGSEVGAAGRDTFINSNAAKTYHIHGQAWDVSSKTRAVNFMSAVKGNPKKGKTYYARWLYKKPGGSAKVGMSWRKASKPNSVGEVSSKWGTRSSNSGPKLPKGTLVCTQFKGSEQKVCHKLK